MYRSCRRSRTGEVVGVRQAVEAASQTAAPASAHYLLAYAGVVDPSIAQPLTPSLTPSGTPTGDPQPPLWRAFLLRFGLCYWVLFGVIDVWGSEIEAFHWLGQIVRVPGDAAIIWFGRSVLGISTRLIREENGSGDKTADWVALVLFALVSLIAAIAWCAIDRRRAHDDRLRAFLHVFMRYTLAFVILGYGISKVFLGQFPLPNANRLLERYGDSSPMGLMWAFMGASPAYVFFSGAAETLGAVLLLFRRTTPLGALVLVAVLTNIVLMNLCYDVCVKLNSSHYLAMSILLLMPDLRRLANVLVLQRPTQPSSDRLVLSRRWLRIARVVIKVGLIALVIGTNVMHGLPSVTPKPPPAWNEGYWRVVRFVRNGVEPMANDATQWDRLRFQDDEGKHMSRWHFADNSYGGLCTYKLDDAGHTITFTPDKDWYKAARPVSGPATLRFTRPDADHLTLEGKVDGAELNVELERLDTSKMLLVARGFHWINEEPFNR
jgi:uncharacterized membrane protein YphA (DoxX/SURF4 family)